MLMTLTMLLLDISNGLIIAWGRTSAVTVDAGGSTSQEVNLPITFSGVMNCMAGCNQNVKQISNVISYTTTTIKIFTGNLANNAQHTNVRTWYHLIGT